MNNFSKIGFISILIFLIIIVCYFMFYKYAYYKSKCKGSSNIKIDDTNLPI